MPNSKLSQLNIIGQCRRLGVSAWQCPQFLFLMMSLIIIGSSLATYFIGAHYITDPMTVALIVLSLTAILFIISFIITQSFEKLAEASRLKSEFINVVSHQLRAPLTNLKWTVELFSSKDLEKDAEKEEEYYSSLKENIARMVELVDDLLIVSKIEEGVYPLRKKEVFLGDIINELISQFRFFAEASNVKISFHQADNLPKIFIDPLQIKLAIENLIDNAVRYTKSGGSIEISLEKKDKSLLFQIKDSGVGIPEEDKKYIFQKFFRAENIMKEQTRGSGLGLSIVKAIIENSGGEVWFKSEERKGTTFYFTLPIK